METDYSRNKKNYYISSLLLLVGLLISFCIALYPTFADAVSSVLQKAEIGTYADVVEHMDSDSIKKERKKAEEYNQKIFEDQEKNAFWFHFTGSDGYTDKKYQSALSYEEYENILNSSGNGVMGYISIPSIDVDLPIYHGTSDKVLQSSVGHMYGTSVISGGAGTHAVISSHTGLANAKLFTDVDKMQLGDIFQIHVLNEVHYYEVDQIKIVLPEEADAYLGITDGEDYVTLYTCTPYGINSHRLLVRGKRTEIQESSANAQNEAIASNKMNTRALRKAIVIGAIPVMILLTGIILILKKAPREIKVSNDKG